MGTPLSSMSFSKFYGKRHNKAGKNQPL